jgi:GNAT superfamily N-acetyltransferase
LAAVSKGRLVGYMIGEMVLDQVWGRSAWVRLPGWALAEGQSTELLRKLYATLGRHWVAHGCFAHFVLAPAASRQITDAWFSLSFGLEQIHALLDLDSAPPGDHGASPASLEIRRAGPADRELLAEFSSIIWSHQIGEPVWGIMLPETVPEVREGWAELAEDSSITVWLAFLEGQPAGIQGFWPAEPSDLAMWIPPKCVILSVAGTRPEFRGRGVGQALTRHGLAQARSAGARYCETDWRSTNLQAARFWPGEGFQPVVYRLVRRVDPRIAWARGQEGR